MSAARDGSTGLRARQLLLLYGALQAGGGLFLGAAWLLLVGIASLLGVNARSFLGSWLAAFVLVPVTFLPVLAWWHPWAVRRCGRHPRWYRGITELAFAAEVVAFVLLQRLA